jgi:hypothetical protein
VLRTLLLLFAAALTLAGAILLVRGVTAPGAYALGLGGLIVLGTAFERWQYRRHDGWPGADWEPTGERFEDPKTGATVQVFYDPRSGERRYVNDPGPPRL